MTLHRLFVGGLSEGIKEQEVLNKFRRFGKVQNVDVHVKHDSEGQIMKTFAYADFNGDQSKLRECVSALNGLRWNGQSLQVQIAKEKFTDRLKKEQAEKVKTSLPNGESSPTKKSTDKNVLTGKLVPKARHPDHHKWVKNDEGKLEPVLNIRQRDKKKMIKHNPSMGKNAVKKLDSEENSDISGEESTVMDLTWKIEEKTSHKPQQKNNHRSVPATQVRDSKGSANNVILHKHTMSPKRKHDRKSEDKSGTSFGVVVFSDSDDGGNTNLSLGKSGTLRVTSKVVQREYSSGEETDDLIDRLKAKKTPEQVSGNVGASTKYAGKVQRIVDIPNDSNRRVSKQKHSSRYISTSSEEEEEEDGTKQSLSLSQTKKDSVKSDNWLVNQISKTVNSDSESDVPDIETWLLNKNITSSTPALSHSTTSPSTGSGVPSSSTPASSHVRKTTKPAMVETRGESSELSDLVNKVGKKNKEVETGLSKPSQLGGAVGQKKKASTGYSSPKSVTSGKLCGKGEAVYHSDDSLSGSEPVGRGPRVSTSSRRSKNSGAVVLTKSHIVEEFSSGFVDNSTRCSSTSDDEDLLDCIAAGKMQKLKEIQRKNRLKYHGKLVKKEAGKTAAIFKESNTPGSTERSVTKDMGEESGSAVNSAKAGHTQHGLQGKEAQLKHEKSNVQRLESLKERQRLSALQRSAVQRALANVDSVEQNKKIVFESDSDQEDGELASGAQVVTDVTRETKKPSLFADSGGSEDSGADVESDTERFNIKPQFEGRKGKKLMELQTKFKGDVRFKIDSRFAESESESDEDTGEKEELGEKQETEAEVLSEKEKNLKVLESVVGRKLSVKKSKKNFQDLVGVHYDPSRVDHEQFEIKKSTETRIKKKKVKSAETTTEEMPEVSKEKFYEVRTSLKDVFHKQNAADPCEKGTSDDIASTREGPQEKPFSLLAMFGATDDSKQEGGKGTAAIPQAVEISAVKTLPWQLEFDSSGDEDSTPGIRSNDKEAEVEVKSITRQMFFFTENDPRLREGLAFFHRQEPLETLREAWQEKRPALVEAYRMRRKRSLRKRRATEVFQARLRKRRKFNNQK